MKKVLQLLILIVCFMSCTRTKDSESDRVTASYIKQAAKQDNLVATATGGSMMNEIKRLTIFFNKPHPEPTLFFLY